MRKSGWCVLWSSCVLIALAGCGVAIVEEASSTLDSGPIRVTVYKPGGDETGAPMLEPNIRVDFIAPDQTTQTVVTDANGVAEAVSPPDTTILVYQFIEAHMPSVHVYYATNPGDSIIVDRTRRVTFPLLGNVTLTAPHRGPQADQYQFRLSCTGFDGSYWQVPTRTFSVPSCPFATHATAVAWVVDANDQPLTGASVMTDLDLTQLVDGTVHMRGYDAFPTTVTGTFNALPATQASWGVVDLNGDDPTMLSTGFATQVVLNGTNQLLIAAAGDRTHSVLQYYPDGYRSVRVEDVFDTRATAVTVDAADAIKPISLASYNRATRTVAWTAAPFGRDGTLALAGINVWSPSRLRGFVIGMFAPGNTTSVQLPPLPAELEPQSDDVIYASAEIQTIEGESYSDMMELAATRNLAPTGWEPLFTGRFWRSGL